MFKLKWQDLGAKLSRVFRSIFDRDAYLQELADAGIAAEIVAAPSSRRRPKPKSKPRVAGGRGESIVGIDRATILVGERCLYRVNARGSDWKRGTLQRVMHTQYGDRAWVAGKYLPWRMVDAGCLKSFDTKLERALEMYPARAEHHERRAAAKREVVPYSPDLDEEAQPA